MGKILLTIFFIFNSLLNADSFEEILENSEFSGEAYYLNCENDEISKFRESKSKILLGEISENIYSIFTLWLSENSSLNLESDVRFQYPLLSELPNEITIFDLLSHSSGITENSIHTGNSQAFYPSLKYDKQDLNYSLLKSIIELQGINFNFKFDEFVAQAKTPNIQIIENLSESEKKRMNFLDGSNDLKGQPENVLQLISNTLRSNLLSEKNEKVSKSVNFSLDEEGIIIKKTLLGDKFTTTNGIEFFLMEGYSSNRKVLLSASSDGNHVYLFQSNLEEDLYKVFEYYYNSVGEDKIDLPETVNQPSLIIFTLPLLLLGVLIFIIARKKK